MALTTLSNVKSYLGIENSDTTYDAFLTRLINAVSESIELYCNRHFDRDVYSFMSFGSDFIRTPHNPDLWGADFGDNVVNYPTIATRGEDIVLDNMPINAVLYAAYGIQPVIEITYDGSAAGSIDVVATEKVILVENLVQTEIDLTDVMSVQDVIDAIDALANWTASAADADYTAFPARSLLNRYVGPEEEDGGAGDLHLCAAHHPFRLLRQTEGLYRANVKVGSNTTILVLYDGGYDEEDLPPSLVEVASKAVADAFRGIGRESELKHEKVGDYDYTKFGDKGAFSYVRPYEAQLDLFRRVPMGVT